MQRTHLSATIGVAIGIVLVVTTALMNNPGWGILSREECQVNQRLGNVTVWVPAAVVASPYHGSESGFVTVWGQSPLGYATLSQHTRVSDGNVTAFYVDFSNLTVFGLRNVSTAGPGFGSPCTSAMIAYFSSNPPAGASSGGTSSWPMYSNLRSDSAFPSKLNASQLCSNLENSSNGSCAVSAQFEMNFEKVSGTVDTCGGSQSQILRLTSRAWPVEAPFQWNHRTYSVPFDPNGMMSAPDYANGTYAWYNYTFPANEGIWDYDNLAVTSSTGAGLVFSYSPCP
jgi:hypothetical protein